MPDPHRVLVSFALATGLTAQLQPTAVLQQAQVRAGSMVAATPTTGSSVWGGVDATAQTANGRARWSAEHALDDLALFLMWSVQAQAWSNGTAVSDAGVRYDLRAPAPGAALLQIGWAATSSGTGAVTCSIDLHDDGSIDAVGPALLPVVFASGPLPVRVRVVATASAGSFAVGWGSTLNYSGNAEGQLSLLVVPSGAQATVTCAACGTAPPTLVATPDFAGQVRLLGALPAGNALGLLVLGLGPSQLPLPWSPGCRLGATPDLVWWQPAGSAGSVAWALPVPAAVRPMSFHAQLLALEPVAWTVAAAPTLRVDLQ